MTTTIPPNTIISIVTRCINAVPETANILVKTPDNDHKRSLIRVKSITEDEDKLNMFAYRQLCSSTVPKGYMMNYGLTGDLCTFTTVERWKSLFVIVHEELQLPFDGSNIDQFVSKFKRINSRRKTRTHPFDRSWDKLEKLKDVFGSLCLTIMNGTSVWRRTPLSITKCRTKLEHYGLIDLLRPESQMKVVCVLWDITCMLRWLVLMVKCNRVERVPSDFDPPMEENVEPVYVVPEMIPMKLTAEEEEWLMYLQMNTAQYETWFSYSMEFYRSFGEQMATLTKALFYPRTIYLCKTLHELRCQFYSWLQQHHPAGEQLRLIVKWNRKLIRACKQNPVPNVNFRLITTIQGFVGNPLVKQWMSGKVGNINPLIIAPPQTWRKLLELPQVTLSNTTDHESPMYQLAKLSEFAQELVHSGIISSSTC